MSALPAQLFLLVAYPHGSRRKFGEPRSGPKHDGVDPSISRARCTLPPQLELHQRIAASGPAPTHRLANRRHLAAMVLATPAGTQLSQYVFEEQCLHNYFGFKPAYALHIQQAWRIVPEEIHFCKRASSSNMQAFATMRINVCLLAGLPSAASLRIIAGGREHPLPEMFRANSPHNDIEQVRVLCVVEPVVRMVLAGQWSHVMLGMPALRPKAPDPWSLPDNSLAPSWGAWPVGCVAPVLPAFPLAMTPMHALYDALNYVAAQAREGSAEAQRIMPDLSAAIDQIQGAPLRLVDQRQQEDNSMDMKERRRGVPTHRYLSLALVSLITKGKNATSPLPGPLTKSTC